MVRRRQGPVVPVQEPQSGRPDSPVPVKSDLEGWAEIIEEQGRQMRGPRVDTIDDSGPVPTEREVQEMNAPGELLEEGVETPSDRCSRGLHEQMESEPWRCVYSEYHVDVNPPDTSRLIVVFSPELVAERETYNWILKQRRKVESGANAGKYAWKDVGFYPTAGHAATRALHIITEQKLGTGGKMFDLLVDTALEVEESLRGSVQRVATAAGRAAAFSEALAVVRDEKDRARLEKLLGPRK